MSEVETQPRDEASGQFVPSTDGLYGREAELVAAGFTVKKDKPTSEGKTYGDGDDPRVAEAMKIPQSAKRSRASSARSRNSSRHIR